MRLPAFAEVVSKPSYTPRGGGETRAGGNTLLGSYGVVGGKTGFTSQAGANYVFAARTHGRLMVGAIMSQPGATSPATAVNAAQPLILAAENALTTVTLAPAGTPMAELDDRLGHRTKLVAAAPVRALGWRGLTLHLSVRDRLAVKAGDERTPLKPARSLPKPSVLDRLIRLR
jgi:D-alanyl-D-alanine carboxypeptidase